MSKSLTDKGQNRDKLRKSEEHKKLIKREKLFLKKLKSEKTDLKARLEESEKDTLLAAELGKNLLETNKALEETNKRLKRKIEQGEAVLGNYERAEQE